MPTPETDFLTRDKFLNTLAESYVLHETILNSTELSVLSANTDGKINSMNKAAERMLGYEADELIGKQTILTLHDPAEISVQAADFTARSGTPTLPLDVLVGRLRKQRGSERREWTFIAKDRTRIPVSASLSGIWNERDELTGFLYIATDISEQKRADKELRESQLHLHALIQSLDDIAFEVNRDGHYLNVWTSREDLLFDQRKNYVGRKMSDILGVPLADRYHEAISRTLATGKAEILEYPSIVPGSDQWYVAKITRISEERVLILVREITEQKKAELALIESERKFRLLAENVPGVIYLCRNDAGFSNLFISPNVERITGYSPVDFLNGNTDIQHLIHPDDFPNVDAAFKRALAEKKSYQFEYRIIHKSGEVRWVKESGAGLYTDQGLDLIEGYLSDITGRKTSDLAIEASEQKFRLLAENIPGVIYLCKNDPTYSMVYLNKNVERITGYRAEEFLSGKVNFVKLYHPDDNDEVFRKVDEAIATRTSFHLEYRIRHKDGTWRWMEEVGEGVYRDGVIDHLEGFISDVTERKRAEAALHTMASENFRIFNYSPCLQSVAGFDGYFKRLNPMWEKTLGWTLEELMSKKFIEFVHPDDVNSTDQGTRMIAEGGSLLSFENRYRCKDGTYRWLLWSAVTDDATKLINASAIDITDRKQSEEQLMLSKTNLELAARELQEQNRQSTEFAHIISHNLRSPVRNIQALISLLNKKSTIDEYREVFHNLQKTSVSLHETLNELLDIMKVKKETSMERSSIVFADVLAKVRQDLIGEIISTNAKITSDFSACDKIDYYKPYLESIMLNLLSNALKYRFPKRKPEITFRTSMQNNKCVLEVQDNGLGIDLERHGESLFGLRKVFHEHRDARGVGLFLTKTQVETLGGKIWAESKVGAGSTFFVAF